MFPSLPAEGAALFRPGACSSECLGGRVPYPLELGEEGRDCSEFFCSCVLGGGDEAGGVCSGQGRAWELVEGGKQAAFSMLCHIREPATSQASSWARELLQAHRELDGTTAMALWPQEVAGQATEHLACLRACPVPAGDLTLLSAT